MDKEREKTDLIERYNALAKQGGITVEECLTQLKEVLRNPRNYQMEGYYAYLGKDNYHSGELTIDEKGNIIGKIKDPTSMAKAHVVLGEIITNENGHPLAISFFKIPTHFLLITVHYVLRKSDDSPEPSGNYEGFWRFLEQGIRLELGWRPGVGEAALVRKPEQRNKASLRLTLKT